MVEQNSKSDEEEVKDRLNLIYFIAMLLGVGILNSYNFLVSAPDYFADQYPDYNVNFYLVPVYTYTDLLFLILTTVFGEALSMTSRILFCFIGNLIVLSIPHSFRVYG